MMNDDACIKVDASAAIERLNMLQYEKLVKKGQIRKMFVEVTRPVKKEVQLAFRQQHPHDPRKAVQGVKLRTYRDANGVLIGLLDNGRARKMMVWRPSRGGVSGKIRNRKKSARTKQQEAYFGKDRAFILRFLNQGTVSRKTTGAGYMAAGANRGIIRPGKFFDRAPAGLARASAVLSVRIQELIKQVYEK